MNKSKHLLGVGLALGSLSVGGALRAQMSAVDGLTTLNQTATVNTAFIANQEPWWQLVPARSSGVYKLVYKSAGTGWTITSESGVYPASIFVPGDQEFIYGYETGKVYFIAVMEGFHYIERYVNTYNSSTGVNTWTRNLYKGPASVAPILQSFTASSLGVEQGSAVTITATAADADYDLRSLAIARLAPGAATWTYSFWPGGGWYGWQNGYFSSTVVLPTVGTWKFGVSVADSDYTQPTPTAAAVGTGFADLLTILVRPAPFYDPSGSAYGGIKPVVTVPTGGNIAIKAGDAVPRAITFKLTGYGAGKPVRVSVGRGGGLLFATSAATGGGASYLELVTNANGEVTVWLRASDRAGISSAVYALAGGGRAQATTLTTTTTDADNDGMSDQMETALNGGSGVVYNPASAPITGFVAWAP